MCKSDANVKYWLESLLYPTLFIALAIVVLARLMPPFRKLIFAKYMDLFSPTYDAMVRKKKARFFDEGLDGGDSLEAILSADVDLRNRGLFRLLELGVGTGTNFKYYPKNVRLVAVDPNEEFLGYFEKNRVEYPHLTLEKFILAKGEELDRRQVRAHVF
jgi:hypothetical protein